MATSAELDQLSNIGVGLIEAQLALAGADPKRALHDIWTVGYCFGVFDSIIQRAKLDMYSEGAAIMAFSFSRLLSDNDHGADCFRYAMDRQTNPVFIAGTKVGGDELYIWLSDNRKIPMALCTHLSPAM